MGVSAQKTPLKSGAIFWERPVRSRERRVRTLKSSPWVPTLYLPFLGIGAAEYHRSTKQSRLDFTFYYRVSCIDLS